MALYTTPIAFKMFTASKREHVDNCGMVSIDLLYLQKYYLKEIKISELLHWQMFGTKLHELQFHFF